MQRVDATTRSPIYTHFSETLGGVETLRAYGLEERFTLTNDAKVDFNHRWVGPFLAQYLECLSGLACFSRLNP